MTEYQLEQQAKESKLTEVTQQIAAGLGKPWKVKPETEGPSHRIVNPEGATLYITTAEYGLKAGRVKIGCGLNVGRNGSYETVYENGNRVSTPTITVALERGIDVIVKEINRRVLPDYLHIFALAVAQVSKHNEKLSKKQAVMRKLAALVGERVPDFEKEPEKDQIWMSGGTIRVGYDCGVTFERLSVTQEQAEYILRYLYRDKNAAK